MIIDMHVHTIYSRDSLLAPEDLIEQAIALGLDAVCVTEHDSYSASEIAELFAERTPLKVFRGVEASTDLGHLLIYGVNAEQWQEYEGHKNLPAQQVVEHVRAWGGVAIPAHPFRVGSPGMADRIETLAGIFAIEGWNGRCDMDENNQALNYAARHNLKVIGGSDAHTVGQLGSCVTVFDRRVESVLELVAELKAGRFEGRYFTGLPQSI